MSQTWTDRLIELCDQVTPVKIEFTAAQAIWLMEFAAMLAERECLPSPRLDFTRDLAKRLIAGFPREVRIYLESHFGPRLGL